MAHGSHSRSRCPRPDLRGKIVRIAIVGAGPAGCHLAHRLAATDHEILLFDPRAPWEKPCGGGLGALVGQLFPDMLALPFPRHTPTRLLLRASDGGQIERSFEQPPWAIVSRADLGRALLDRALADGRVRFLRQKVTGVTRSGDGWQVRTTPGQASADQEVGIDFLVGADGVRSLVRRQMVGPIPRQHLGLAVGYRVQGAPDAVVFQTFADLEGYLWSFPRLDHASVGIGGRLGALPARELWQRLDQFLDDACPGACRERRWAALLPLASDPTLWDTPCTGPGWALLGDAAGHVQPITGEGIAYALWSAELLAQAFAEGDPLAYEELWRARYGGDLASASQVLQHGIAVGVGGYEVLFHTELIASVLGMRGLNS
jgi:flavin-dependent dehydrogenase